MSSNRAPCLINTHEAREITRQRTGKFVNSDYGLLRLVLRQLPRFSELPGSVISDMRRGRGPSRPQAANSKASQDLSARGPGRTAATPLSPVRSNDGTACRYRDGGEPHRGT